jgi:DNA-binding CsgD family transcriptional regulator
VTSSSGVPGQRDGEVRQTSASLLVDRDEQRAAITTAFRMSIEEGRGRVLLVSGPVGFGKTVLLEDVGAEAIRMGGHMLSATGSASERDIPFGAVRQLLHTAHLDSAAVDRLIELVPDVEPSVLLLPEPGARLPGTLRPRELQRAAVLHGLFVELVRVADRAPLMLLVDDAHHADVASLHFLLYLSRRLRRLPITIVLSEALTVRPTNPLMHAELASQPHFALVRLPPLSLEAVVALLGGPHREPAQREAECLLAQTGGNPQLLRALMGLWRDRVALPRPGRPEGAAGPGFLRALVAVLYRHEPEVRTIAQALAVLGRPVTTEHLADVSGVPPRWAAQVMSLLEQAGLATTDGLRHPELGEELLTHMTSQELQALHHRAARTLHRAGRDPGRVAEHLVSADRCDDPWMVRSLQKAARRAAEDCRPDVALSYLDVLDRANLDDQVRPSVQLDQVAARWQVDPEAAAAQLAEVERSPWWRPSEPWAIREVPYLLWQGRSSEARKMLDEMARARMAGGVGDCDESEHTGQWAAGQLLALLSDPGTPSACPRAAWESSEGELVAALTLLVDGVRATGERDVAEAAESLRRRHRHENGALGSTCAILIALLIAGRNDDVVSWAGELLDRIATSPARTWRAILAAIRAEACLRMSDLTEADRHISAALTQLPPRSWGMAVAAPLATMVSTATERGDLDSARHWLAQPLPAGTFSSPCGALYLAARGRYFLAAGDNAQAAEQLRRCGEMMRSRGMDAPGLVPWRVDLATALLTSGEGKQARRLLEEQLVGVAGTDRRTAGRALRLLAGLSPVDQQGSLLSEAVTALEACGDRAELARALADTHRLLDRLGHGTRSRMLFSQARHLDSGCRGDRPLDGPQLPVSPSPSGTPADGNVEPLSKAERRVVTWASKGLTNQQISAQLYITVSTVEQHLTRAYRKLDIKRRAELPAALARLVNEPLRGVHAEVP